MEEELAVGRALAGNEIVAALVVCGVERASRELGDAIRGWLGPVQWDGRRRPPVDIGHDAEYPGAQALAACLLVERVRMRATPLDEPDALWRAALQMRCETFFGRFAVDGSGRQVGHRPTIVRWCGEGSLLRREPVLMAM